MNERSAEDLEQSWADSGGHQSGRGRVHHLVIRPRPGEHEEPMAVHLSPEQGVDGDRWEMPEDGDADDQVTLMMVGVARILCGDRPLHLPGDNVLVDIDLSEENAPPGTRFQLGEAIVEVTAKPHLGCKKFHERFGPGALRWVNLKENRPRKLRGVNARVIQAGTVHIGDHIQRL